MNLPDDYGLSLVQTAASVLDLTPDAGHSSFWGAWCQAVFAGNDPALRERVGSHGDPTDPTATHEFVSLGNVRIGVALHEPPNGTPVRAGLVALHGYERVPTLSAESERWDALRRRGVAVMSVRVRGFPGSMADTPAMASWPLGWITYGLDAVGTGPDELEGAMNWVVPRAVADVVNAVRAFSRRVGPRVPMFLHGESFGGGMAVLAAAALDEHRSIDRLAVALPSLAGWSWRLEHGFAGSAAEIASFVRLHSARREVIERTLRLADVIVHAPRVRSAALFKLAGRDDVVPAPTAAAVFNALGTDPGRKLRVWTPYGHFDGGLANARAHAAYERAVDEFLDPCRNPDEAVAAAETAVVHRRA